MTKNTWVKVLIALLVIALGTIATGNPVLSADKELNILTWCDHTDPNLLRPFEQKHKVRINMKEYDGTGVALALLEQSKPGDWDVFVVDSIDIKRVVKCRYLRIIVKRQPILVPHGGRSSGGLPCR